LVEYEGHTTPTSTVVIWDPAEFQVALVRLQELYVSVAIEYYWYMYLRDNARDAVSGGTKCADGEQLWGDLSDTEKEAVYVNLNGSLPEVYQDHLKTLQEGDRLNPLHIEQLLAHLRGYKEQLIDHNVTVLQCALFLLRYDAMQNEELLRVSQLQQEWALNYDAMHEVFKSGAILYHLYAKIPKSTLTTTATPRTTTTLHITHTTTANSKSVDGQILWDALSHEEQVDVYKRFQHALPPNCQQHLIALSEEGWLHPHHIEIVMRYLRDAKTYLAASIDQLLHVDDNQ